MWLLVFELLHSKSIIKSSELIDSHGDNVSSDSVRDIFATVDLIGFESGAGKLAKLLLSDAAFCRAFDADFSDDTSFSVGVSTIDCSCVFDATHKINETIKQKTPQFKSNWLHFYGSL